MAVRKTSETLAEFLQRRIEECEAIIKMDREHLAQLCGRCGETPGVLPNCPYSDCPSDA